ncbi:alkaline phosphatase family protein [Archangium gephyra]|uniref:hypothetical protein n=1 Tax=Archangium gephyra TaxID=48 RepID=UPI0035D43DD2
MLAAYSEAGVLEDTYVLFVSDHGHTPVLSDDRHALSAEGEDEPTTVLEHAGFRLRPMRLEVEPPEQDFQAVVAYQGAMAPCSTSPPWCGCCSDARRAPSRRQPQCLSQPGGEGRAGPADEDQTRGE